GFIAITMLAATHGVDAQAADPYPGFDAYAAKAIQTWKIPGLSIAIVRNDSVIYARGFGVLSAQRRTPVNQKTLFEIGSTSRPLTILLPEHDVSRCGPSRRKGGGRQLGRSHPPTDLHAARHDSQCHDIKRTRQFQRCRAPRR